MTDIKLTLSTDTTLRAPNIGEEANWMQQEGKLSYPLHSRPKYAKPGCWVYFIREGQLVARAVAEDFVETTGALETHTYTGVPSLRKRWSVECSAMELATNPIPHRGFQGFRYIKLEEQALFEQAFTRDDE